jgi:resuscitation-promoting factor RpfB
VVVTLASCAAPVAERAPVGQETSATPKAKAATPAVSGRKPKVERRLVVETRRVPFRKLRVEDPSLEDGKTVVTTRGVNGRTRLTFEVTLVDGVAKGRRLVRQTVVRAPVDQVTSIGTKVAADDSSSGSCDSNYSGGCVPIASDVDCAGGSGNGPEYVEGPVTVVGDDLYGLDRDKDGIGCED